MRCCYWYKLKSSLIFCVRTFVVRIEGVARISIYTSGGVGVGWIPDDSKKNEIFRSVSNEDNLVFNRPTVQNWQEASSSSYVLSCSQEKEKGTKLLYWILSTSLESASTAPRSNICTILGVAADTRQRCRRMLKSLWASNLLGVTGSLCSLNEAILSRPRFGD
jgi:hypothetical protein